MEWQVEQYTVMLGNHLTDALQRGDFVAIIHLAGPVVNTHPNYNRSDAHILFHTPSDTLPDNMVYPYDYSDMVDQGQYVAGDQTYTALVHVRVDQHAVADYLAVLREGNAIFSIDDANHAVFSVRCENGSDSQAEEGVSLMPMRPARPKPAKPNKAAKKATRPRSVMTRRTAKAKPKSKARR